MRYLVLLLACCFALSACRKKKVCKGNCADIRISGRMYDRLSNQGMAAVPVEVKWLRDRWCFCTNSYDVGHSTTDANGYYDFTVTADTSMFDQFHLAVRLPIPAGYLHYFHDNYAETSMQTYTPGGLQNTQFGFYPKTNLDINLHRVLSDTVKYFAVSHSFEMTTSVLVLSGNALPAARDTTIHTVTAVGRFTTVELVKQKPSLTYTRQKDSVLCIAGGPNTIDIYY